MRAVMQGRLGMRTIKVKKDELLTKVIANREKHKAAYIDAMTDYKDVAIAKIEEVMDELKARIGRLKEGQTLSMAAVSFPIPVPEDHTKDYDQVIAMLQMSIDTELEVQSNEFACYVMDDWDWKEDFGAVTSSNKLAAMTYRSSK